jgi:hypothetical protein
MATDYFDWNFECAEIADAPTGRNDHTIALIERIVDAGKPLPLGLATSIYLYADDYFRLKASKDQGKDIPLRKRAAGQYYLDKDRYPDRRILQYTCMPLTKVDGGYIFSCSIETMEEARHRLGLDLPKRHV